MALLRSDDRTGIRTLLDAPRESSPDDKLLVNAGRLIMNHSIPLLESGELVDFLSSSRISIGE